MTDATKGTRHAYTTQPPDHFAELVERARSMGITLTVTTSVQEVVPGYRAPVHRIQLVWHDDTQAGASRAITRMLDVF